MLITDKMNEIEQFNIICRLCLDQVQSTNKSVIISECFIGENPLKTIIQLCGHIKIEDEDKLPKKVCLNCLDTLYKSYCFMKQCKISDQKLHDLLEANNKQQQEKCLDQTITEKVVEEEVNSQLLEPIENIIIIEKDNDISDASENNNCNNFEIKNEKISNKYDISSNYKVEESEVEESSANDSRTNKIEARERAEFSSADSNQQEEKMTDVQQVEEHICEHCGRCFNKKNSLTKHIRIHTGAKPFVCEICCWRFSEKSNLQRHIMTHTGERPYICDICGKSFVQAGSLRQHRVRHSKEKSFSCTYCDRHFKSRYFQQLHIQKYHKTSPEECKSVHINFEKKDINKPSKILRFLCSFCGRGFRANAQLQMHLRVHTGEKPFVCSYCNKSFRAESTLRAHHFIHTGEKPYICKICGKGFKQVPHLKHHLQWHSGVKPYKCSYCDKGFTSKRAMSVHVKRHTGDAQYRCPYCEKWYYDDHSLKQHKKIHELKNDVKLMD